MTKYVEVDVPTELLEQVETNQLKNSSQSKTPF